MSNILIEKINNLKVKPIKRDGQISKPVKGKSILGDSPFINIMQVASTSSGKTTATFKILKESVVPEKTTIVAFVPSIYNDENWIAIREYFEDLNTNFVAHTSTKDEKGQDLLKEYVKLFTEEAEEREQKRKEKRDELFIPKKQKRLMHFQDCEKKRKEKEPKYIFAEYIFIFDDISDELRNRSYEALVKKARHYHIMTITSSQDAKDITPASIKQMRLWLLFKNLDEERLYHIWSKLGVSMPFQTWLRCYKHATQDTNRSRFNFFYFQPRDLEMRMNFSHRFILE